MFERWESMDRRTLARLAVAAVVGLVILGAVLGGVRQAGWNEGFLVGLLAGNGDSQALAPYLAYRTGAGWHDGLGFVGGFFKFLLFGFLFVLFMKFVGFWRWRMHGDHPWHHRGPWQPGPQSQPGPGSGGSGQPEPPADAARQNTTWINV